MTITAPALAPVNPSIGTRPIPITKESLLEAVTLVVAERGPDYVYDEGTPSADTGEGPTCYYRIDGVGSCVFGRALMNMGYTLRRTYEFASITSVFDRLDVPATEHRLRNAAARAQNNQDHGMPYGEMLEQFKADLND